LLAYIGGDQPQTPAEGEAVMQAWTRWFGSLGESVVDLGNPAGACVAISPAGTVTPGAGSGLTGYSVISAASSEDAAAKVVECPHLAANGTVEVYEIHSVM
jgi:hypothetical protein